MSNASISIRDSKEFKVSREFLLDNFPPSATIGRVNMVAENLATEIQSEWFVQEDKETSPKPSDTDLDLQ